MTCERLPITAIVVTCNEAGRLEACLRSIRFCDEIIVCDLQSTDGSAEIGKTLSDRHFEMPRVPIVEILFEKLICKARNDWILRFDPDQVMTAGLADVLVKEFDKRNDAVCLHLPQIYYFLGRPIYFSVWGKVRNAPLLFDRRQVNFTSAVHSGITFAPGLSHIVIQGYDNHAIEHYWVDSIRQMIEKHLRYLRHEGSGRAKLGERFAWGRLKQECQASWRANFTDGGCFVNGWRGYYLGGFHMMYTIGSHLSLALHQLRRPRR